MKNLSWPPHLTLILNPPLDQKTEEKWENVVLEKVHSVPHSPAHLYRHGEIDVFN